MKKAAQRHWQTIKPLACKGLALLALYYGPARIAGKLIGVIKSKWLRGLLLVLLEPLIERLIRYIQQRSVAKTARLVEK